MNKGARIAFGGGGAVVVIAIVALYVMSPWITFQSMRSAARSGDHRAVADHVDFPALRENLRGQISQFMMARLNEDSKARDNPFAGLGMALAAAMVGPMVDAMVTPEALAQAFNTGRLKPTRGPGGDPQSSSVEQREIRAPSDWWYDTHDRFIVRYTSSNDSSLKMDIVMRRRGMFSWQITEIAMPFDQIARRAQ